MSSIVECSWGKVVVSSDSDRTTSSYKDVVIFTTEKGKGYYEWKFSDKTNHADGLSYDEVRPFLSQVDEVIISSGMEGRFSLGSVGRKLRRLDIIVHYLPTPEALKLYNELSSEKKNVVAFIHTTC